MSEITTPPKKSANFGLLTLDLFGVGLRSLWVAILIAVVCLEIVPIPSAPSSIVYSCYAAKALLFLALGLLTPLAFSSFNSMIRAAVIAGGMTPLVALFQYPTHPAHNHYFIQLALKLLILMGGFCGGIVSRYDRSLSFGNVHISLNESRQ